MSLTLALGLVAATAVTTAIGVGRRFGERYRVRRTLRAVRVLEPSSAEGAHVRITGTVRVFERELFAPLSGRRCVAYRARARAAPRPRRAGVPFAGPALPPESLLIAPFVVDGPEGSVLVDGDHAIFDLPPSKFTDEDNERLASFLAFHGCYAEQAARFNEVALEAGMVVSVAGVMLRDVALEPEMSERAFRQGPPALVRLTGNREHPLVIGLASKRLALPAAPAPATSPGGAMKPG